MAETEEERRARIDRVMNGEETVTPKIERVVPTYFFDDEGKERSATELARGANYEGRKPAVETNPIIPQGLLDTIEMQAKSLPILRNMLGTNEKDEARAYEVGKKLGLNPQALLDNADLDREATLAYEGQRNRDFLNGKPFSPKTLQELYPEVDVNDTVAASMALRDFNDLRETRDIVGGFWDMTASMPLLRNASWYKKGMRETDEYSLKKSESNSIMDAWNAGTRDVEASRIMDANMKGTISDEEAKRQIEALYAGEEEYEKKKRGVFNIVVDDTVRNLSNMAQITMDGMKDIVSALGPQAAPMIRQLAQSAAIAGGGLAAAGLGSVPIAIGGTIAGVGIGALSLFVGSYKQMRAQNYWDMMQKRSRAGRSLYTKEEAAHRASVQAFWQAGLETVGAEVVIGKPLSKVFGGDVSKAIIQNAAARTALATAGRKVIRKETAKAAAKQFAAGSAFELSEEGMQQVIADVDETVFGNDPKTMNEIFWNAVEAMAEAAPAVVGMTLPGAGLHGAGTYRGYRSLQKIQMKDAVEEYKRETEKDMVSALLKQRDRNNLYKKSPEVYGKTIQAQMERSGKDTLYIDAASIAETEEGRAALSELSDKNIVSVEEIQNAVENNTPLEVKPGVYMQEVTQETAEVISDNATFDKGGRTLAAIQKSREHYKNVMAKWEEMAAERESKAVDAFVDEILPSRQKGEDFLAGTDIEDEQIAIRERQRAILKEILAEDISHPLEALKRAEEKAREEFYDVAGSAQEKADYIRHHSGTVEIIQDLREQQYANVKVSSNDGWYSNLYKKLGKKPTIRDAEDAAYEEAYSQADAAGDTEWKEALKAAKERRDVLYSLRGVIESIDTQDLAARASLSQEAYNGIYVPIVDTLKGANPEVAKAAKDSALILAKEADIVHALYDVPYEDAVRVVLGDRAAETGAGVYNMATHDMRKDGIQTAGEFYEEVQKYRANNEDVNKIRFTSPSGVIYLGSNMNHVEIGSHQLGKEQYDDMDSHIELMRDVHLAFRGKKLMGQYGIPFVGRVVGEKESYYVVIEIDPKSGGIFFITGLSRKPEAISNMLKKDIKITEEAIKNGKIDSQIHTKLSAGPLGNQSFPEISIQELKEKVNALAEEEKEREKNLVVYHNVSLEKLNDAIQLGGLPMPSLAVTKKDISFDNFGDITLIGNRDMIDPQNSKDNDVFSRDGYTVRRPGIGYDAASPKKEAAFHKKYKAAANELKEKGIEVYEIDFSAYTGENAIRRIARDEAVQYFYIKNVLGQDVTVENTTVTPKIPNKGFFETYPGILKALQDSKVADGDFSDLDKACQPYFAKLEERIKSKKGLIAPVKRQLEEMQRDGHITAAGVDLLKKWMNEYEDGLKKKPYEMVDANAFQNAMDDIIKKTGRDKFDAYVRQEWEALDQKKYLWDNGKKYKFTVDNIVKLMKRYRGTNNEGSGGVGYGFNSLLAFLSKKFHSIDEIKESETSLAPNEEKSAQYEKAETIYDDLLEEATNLRPDEYEEVVEDDLANLLRDTHDGKKKNHGFPKNEAFTKHIKEFLAEVDKVTTAYFEAKPARNVSFSEFSGAVVPKGTPKETIDFLKNQGLEVVEYDYGIDGDREAKTEELAMKKDVYFQPAWHGSPYTFDTFDLGKIGSGEGNQAHGWGLYFAADKEVADSYKKVFNETHKDVLERTIILNGQRYRRWGEKSYLNTNDDLVAEKTPMAIALARLDEKEDAFEAIKETKQNISQIEKRISWYDDPSFAEGNSNREEVLESEKSDFEAEKEALKILESGLSNSRVLTGAVRYQVDVPENSVLLDEQKSYGKQPEKVKENLSRAIKELNKERKEKGLSPIRPGNASGRNLYNALSEALGGDKEASLFLNEHGIKGITYDGQSDGRCFVVFDDKAVSIINTYNQEANAKYAGQYSEAENLIRVFSAGNASTVVHESAHAWLSMLERLVRAEADKRGLTGTTDEILAALSSDASVNQNMIRDLSTIREWAKYSPEALAEYKGTALEKEFAKHAEDIAKGIPGAEERFIQERFARAFERYLMTGKAPSKDLRAPFRRFKAWLMDIYKTVKNLGQVDPPKDITRIFDQMLATKEEIDAWAAEKKLIARNLPLDYSATEKENIERWQEEIKEKAKEKCMAAYMERITGDLTKNFEDSLDMLRDEFLKQLVAENPIYQLETMQKLHPTEKDWQSFLQEQGYTPESYEAAIDQAGGHMDVRLDKMIEDARNQYNASLMTPENIRAIAEAELATPEGMQELVQIETKMMNDRLSQYIRTAAASLIEIRNTEDISHIAYEIKKRNGLTTAEDEKAYEAEREKEKHVAEKGALKEKIQNAEAEKAKLRGEIKARMEALRAARDLLNWKTRDLRQKAESTLAKEDVSKATNWKWWDNKSKSAAIRVSDAIKKGDWMTAAIEKRNEAYFSMMSRVAHENEATMKKVLRGDPKTADPNDKDGMAKYGVLGILNRIGRKEKPVLMQEQARYFCQHFAYQMGLIGKDGVLPVNEKGNVVDFSWVALARELNPTQAMTAEAAGGIYDGADVIAPWIKTIFDGKDKTLVGTMSFEHFLDAMDAIRAAYKIGRREYEGNTLRMDGKPISFEEAAKKLITSKWTGKIEVPFFAKQRETALSRKGKALKRAVTELALPEILWERLGDAWYELFYQTIDRAANVERTMMEEASANINKTVNHYSRKEWQSIRNDKKYRLGNDETGKPVYYTKETVLVAALNWGSGANRARLVETLRVTRDEVEDFIFRNMTDKDWDFVEAVWDHINSYYPARNAVQDHLYGVPLGKVKAYTFTLPSGREIKGNYYPIKYDAETASVSAERSVNEIIQQGMMGVSTFGLGMGSTKQRTFTSGGQNLRLDLEVYLDHVAEAVHHVAMREATVDVYKLISRQDVMDNIVERVGIDTYNTLKQWAADQWHSPIDRMTNFEKLLTRLRRHMTFAAMAYRASTAILNAANIFPVMEKMGAANALYALGDYYTGDVRKKRAFVMEKSSFMRGRQTNMERDFARERKLPVGQHTIKGVAVAKGALEEVNTFGYWAIVETDFMLSLPQWLATYKKTRQELSTKNMTAEEIDAEAVRRADKAVRETFGSGEIKDQTAVMKSKFLGQITPFYSYTALVMNQFIRAGYNVADTGNWKQAIKVTFYWWVLNAVAESALRQLMAAASGDDREDYWQRLIYSFAGAGPVGGVPIARDIVPWMAAKSMGLYKGDGKSDISALSVADDAMKVWSDLMADDIKWLNVGRDATRVGNRIYGASDTLTDGFWNLLKLLTTDTDKTALEIIASFILDKDIEKKKGAKK